MILVSDSIVWVSLGMGARLAIGVDDIFKIRKCEQQSGRGFHDKLQLWKGKKVRFMTIESLLIFKTELITWIVAESKLST